MTNARNDRLVCATGTPRVRCCRRAQPSSFIRALSLILIFALAFPRTIWAAEEAGTRVKTDGASGGLQPNVAPPDDSGDKKSGRRKERVVDSITGGSGGSYDLFRTELFFSGELPIEEDVEVRFGEQASRITRAVRWVRRSIASVIDGDLEKPARQVARMIAREESRLRKLGPFDNLSAIDRESFRQIEENIAALRAIAPIVESYYRDLPAKLKEWKEQSIREQSGSAQTVASALGEYKVILERKLAELDGIVGPTKEQIEEKEGIRTRISTLTEQITRVGDMGVTAVRAQIAELERRQGEITLFETDSDGEKRRVFLELQQEIDFLVRVEKNLQDLNKKLGQPTQIAEAPTRLPPENLRERIAQIILDLEGKQKNLSVIESPTPSQKAELERLEQRIANLRAAEPVIASLPVPIFRNSRAGRIVRGRGDLTPVADEVKWIVEKLRQKDDPKIRVVFENSTRKVGSSHSFIGPSEVVIKIPTGSLGLIRNLSELAGLLAYEISSARQRYIQQLEELIAEEKIRRTGNIEAQILAKIEDYRGKLAELENPTEAPKDKKTKTERQAEVTTHKDRIRSLQEAIFITDHLRRNPPDESRSAKKLIEQHRLQIDVSGVNRRNIEALKAAVDRLAAGGFDPWGILDPLTRFANVNREISGPISLLFRFGKSPNMETELEFASWYNSYLEKKEVSIHQPYRGRELPPALSRLQNRVWFKQVVLYGPVMKEYFGPAGIIAGGYVFFQSARQGKEMVREQTAKESAAYADDALKTADSAKNWLLRQFESFTLPELPNVSLPDVSIPEFKLPNLSGIPLPNIPTIPDWMRGIDLGPLGDLFEIVTRTLFESSFITGIGLSIGSVVGYFLQNIRNEMGLITSNIMQRLVNNLRSQARVTRKLAFWNALPANLRSTERLLEIMELQRHIGGFIQDGVNPDMDRVAMRTLYLLLTNRIDQLVNKPLDKQDPQVRKIMLAYRERAKKLLAEQDAQSRIRAPRTDRSQDKRVNTLAAKLFYGDFLKGDTEVFKANVSDSVRDTLNNGFAERRRAQQGYYRTLGALNRVAAAYTTAATIRSAVRTLNDPKTSEMDRVRVLDALEGLRGIELLDIGVKRLFADSLKKFGRGASATLSVLSTAEMGRIMRGEQAPPAGMPRPSITEYRIALGLAAQNKELSTPELVAIFSALVDEKMYKDAMRLFTSRMDLFLEAIRSGAISGSERELFFTKFRDLAKNWDQLPFNFITRSIFMDALFLRIVSIKDPEMRYALYSQMRSAARRSQPLLTMPIRRWVYDWVVSRGLDESVSSIRLVERIPLLAENTGAHAQSLALYFRNRLVSDPMHIRSLDDIWRVLNYGAYWDRLENFKLENLHSFERPLVERYLRLGKQFQSYTYNPQHSEAVQKVLWDRYQQLNPNASLRDQALFWGKLASRGTTGVTDRLFSQIYRQMPAGREKAVLTRYALSNGLIGSDNLRAAVYRDARGPYISEEVANKSAEERVSELRTRMDRFLQANPGDRRAAFERVLSYFGEAFAFPRDPKFEKDMRGKLVRIFTVAGVSGPKPISERVDAVFAENKTQLFQGARMNFFKTQYEEVASRFGDSPDILVSLGNWVANRVRANLGETEFIRGLSMKQNTESADIAVNSLKDLVDKINEWSKSDRWKFIRWLRRSTDTPPERLYELFQTVGLETMRSMYDALPILGRAALLSRIIGAQKRGLLEGRSKNLFYEQILSEVLPNSKQAAEIASDFLLAFLKSAGNVSHPAKRTQIIAFLLANKSEDANVGQVLRQVLEQFGVPGVKIGQLLAASDLMPPEIRKELAKLRDQANEPLRIEIYARLKKIFGIDSVEKYIELLDIKGSASVKYAITVRDRRDGSIHVLQVKREEADKSISRDFDQLREVMADMIKQNARRYAFLGGMVFSTEAAIKREVVFSQEDANSRRAKEVHYDRINYPPNIELRFPNPTDLIDSLPISRDAKFYIRSSELVPGATIDKLDRSGQEQMSRFLLEFMHDVFYPEESRGLLPPTEEQKRGNPNARIEFEPDRHPGNELSSELESKRRIEAIYSHGPIDFGQFLGLDAAMTIGERDRILRLMAYAEVFRLFGPVPEVMAQFFEEFPFTGKDKRNFLRAMRAYFPADAGRGQGAIGAYYYLIGAMERAGFERSIANYEFIKAHFQLEPNEEILVGKEHRSPKLTMERRVEAIIRQMQVDLNVDKVRLAKDYIFSMGPLRGFRSIQTVRRNVAAVESGQLELRGVLEVMQVSQRGIDALLKAAPSSFANAVEAFKWLEASIKDINLNGVTEADRAKYQHWRESTVLKEISIARLEASDFFRIMRSPGVISHMNRNTELRGRVSQPEFPGFVQSVGQIYGAELVAALAFSLYDKDPHRFWDFISSLYSLEKHAGFAGFALTSGILTEYFNQRIPHSRRITRYLAQHGFSMAAGMVAQDIVMRMIQGQSTEEILDHTLSLENAQETGYLTLAFLAASGGLDGAIQLASKSPYLKAAGCRLPMKALWKYSAIFIAAEMIDRSTRDSLTEAGVLPQTTLWKLQKLKEKYDPLVTKTIDDFRRASNPNAEILAAIFGRENGELRLPPVRRISHLVKRDGSSASSAIMGTTVFDNSRFFSISKEECNLDELSVYLRLVDVSVDDNLNRAEPGTIFEHAKAYLDELEAVELEAVDSYAVRVIGEERSLFLSQLRSVLETGFFLNTKTIDPSKVFELRQLRDTCRDSFGVELFQERAGE